MAAIRAKGRVLHSNTNTPWEAENYFGVLKPPPSMVSQIELVVLRKGEPVAHLYQVSRWVVIEKMSGSLDDDRHFEFYNANDDLVLECEGYFTHNSSPEQFEIRGKECLCQNRSSVF